MPLLQDLSWPEGIRTAIWHISGDEELLLQPVDGYPFDIEAVTAIKHPVVKRQKLAVIRLLGHLLGERIAGFRYDASGKPGLETEDIHLSVSHAGPYAAVCVSTLHRVGIDIEEKKPRLLRVRDRFLNKAELEELHPDAGLEPLYYYWCAKEAVFKIFGSHGTDFRNDIRIHPIDYLCIENVHGKADLLMGGEKLEVTLRCRRVEEAIMVVASL